MLPRLQHSRHLGEAEGPINLWGLQDLSNPTSMVLWKPTDARPQGALVLSKAPRPKNEEEVSYRHCFGRIVQKVFHYLERNKSNAVVLYPQGQKDIKRIISPEANRLKIAFDGMGTQIIQLIANPSAAVAEKGLEHALGIFRNRKAIEQRLEIEGMSSAEEGDFSEVQEITHNLFMQVFFALSKGKDVSDEELQTAIMRENVAAFRQVLKRTTTYYLKNRASQA